MKTLFGLPFAAFLSAQVLAQVPPPAISHRFSKSECAVSYEKADKSYSFKIIKKETARKLHQKLPTVSKSVACSNELKAELKLTAQNCQVFCNPN